MKTILLSTLLLSAAAPGSTYYLGEQTLSDPQGKTLSVEALFVERREDRAAGLIVERARAVQPKKCLDDHTATLHVTGNHFTMTEDTGTTTGRGDFFGPAWQWHSFRATFTHSSGVRIEDVNYMMDPSVLVAHKTIYAANGKEILQMHDSVHQISEALYRSLTSALPTCQ